MKTRIKIALVVGIILVLAISLVVNLIPADRPQDKVLETQESLASPVATSTPLPRPLQLYMVDRISASADYAKLAQWGINSAVVDISINGTTASWQSLYDTAHGQGISIWIWPNQGGDVSGCGWETPFNSPVNGSYIERVKPMLDFWKTRAAGIIIAHEPMWESSSNCKDSVTDLSTIHSQIHAYTNTPAFEVGVYVDNIIDTPYLDGYTGPADLDKIMDVAFTWQHCAGSAESACEGNSDSSLERIKRDRAILTNANSKVRLIFLMQTFTTGGYGTKFTLAELQKYSCDFLATQALDGFGYYTWHAWWPDMHLWSELWPAIPYIRFCSGGVYPPTNTPAGPTATKTATLIPTITPTPTNTIVVTTTIPTLTRTPTIVPTITPTPPPVIILPAPVPFPVVGWMEVTGATYYHLQISTSRYFTTSALNINTTSTSYRPSSSLPAGNYYWRVRACATTCGAWSVRGTFRK